MTLDLSSFRTLFLEEAREHTAMLEQGLLRLEHEPTHLDSIHSIFRAAHSVKGAAGTLGFTEIAAFTHRLETILDVMRQGSQHFDSRKVTVLLQATDELRRMIEGLAINQVVSGQCEALDELMMELGHGDESRKPKEPPLVIFDSRPRKLVVEVAPSPRLFATGLDPMLLFRDLESLGVVEQNTCDLSRVPRLSQLDPADCHVSWSVRLATELDNSAIDDVFVFVTDDCSISIVEEVLPDIAASRAKKTEGGASPPVAGHESATLRVSSEKVDAIIDLVGELVIAQSMVMQLLGQAVVAKNPTLRDAAESMTRNMQELQERVMGIRMVPVATLFGRYSRIVRDTASVLNKTVELELVGQDTEIDKVVVERLVDPITHLVRNALDHGLETDAERVTQGKRELGRIRLSGEHVAGGVIIEVQDNGRGLNTTRIREKAIEKGLISATEQLTEEQTQMLIFEPGFSTANVVSDLSGRGVGMDVVRRCVDSLNGTITLSSVLGQGTTVRIRLPLTLAILDGLLLRVGTYTYIVPLLAVVESFRPTLDAVKQVTGSGMIAMVRGDALPLVDLGFELGLVREARNPSEALVVVVEADGKRLGLVVDGMLGQSQVVVKSIETHYRRVEGILGATILGDGKVAFIVDVAGLARLNWARKSGKGAACAA